tara:strand:+ start:2648 stop:4195 length:1548 start_codon:yes stop_codon:yes gene_type:complete
MALTKVQNTGIADDAVTTDKIENTTVVAADIVDGTVTADKLASTLDLSSKTVTLKNSEVSNAELANSSLTINGNAISLGGSGTVKHIDWQAVTVADGSTQLTAVAGRGYFLDTNTGVIEILLPSSPSRGDTFVFADYGGNFATNQIIINTGGQKIDSTDTGDVKVQTNNSIVEMVYVDANKGYLVKMNQTAGATPGTALTGFGGYDTVQPLINATGGTIISSGNDKIHVFTGDGTFCVASISPDSPGKVDYLVVAGGGNGGSRGAGGAGGARAGMDCRPSPATYINNGGLPISATSYPITVGGGGAPTGSNSVFSTITSAGGGKGGNFGTPPGANGVNGGSGGGGGAQITANPGPGGTGNTPPVSPPQGNPGGAGSSDQTTFTNGAGGGGWATAGGGTGGSNTASKRGGDGHPVTVIFGCAPQPFYQPNPADAGQGASATGYFAGGGGGYMESTTPGTNVTDTNAGIGGGGQGGFCGSPNARPGKAGTANTGGGGGGGSAQGGKGIVIIKYKFEN